MALARSIGGAVRELGRKVLAKVRRVDVTQAAATPPAPEVVELLHKLQELMTEFRLTGQVGAPEELSPPHVQAPQSRNVLRAALARYRSLDREALLDDPEYVAFLARFFAAFGMYVQLNRCSGGAGMAVLGRSVSLVADKIFKCRICNLSGIAS
jgi:hypothetical protein